MPLLTEVFIPIGAVPLVGARVAPAQSIAVDEPDELVMSNDFNVNVISGADRTVNPIGYTLAGAGGGSTGLPTPVVPPQYIRGQVIGFDGTGVPRTVICVDRNNGRRLGVAVSDENGFFEMRPATREPVLLVAVPLDEEQINAVVLDNIMPVPE